jgi:thiamine-phosphate pyrophosphorylase
MNKSKIPAVFGFYAILTEPVRGYAFLTELLVEHRVAFIQLRMKDAAPRDMTAIARTMRAITSGSASRFIVNDDPAIARDCGADGVHLGQTDMPYEAARAIMGPAAIIGLSTHTPAQTRSACSCGPDYIGIGPLYPTPTKKCPDPAIGIDGMRRMLAVATVPAVVLGAITGENLARVIEAGADNFSLVRPLNAAADPRAVLVRLLDIHAEAMARRGRAKAVAP